MSHKTYRAKVPTTHTRGIVPQGFEAPFPDASPPDPAIWEPVDGVWPEVKQAAPPHWSDAGAFMPDEVVVALRVFQTPEEFLRVLSLGATFANGVKPGPTEQGAEIDSPDNSVLADLKFREAAPGESFDVSAPVAPEATTQPVPGKVGKASGGKPANAAKPQG